MIKIDFSRDSGRIRLKMQGHAGSDIVCAGTSGIFYALLGYLANEKKSELRVGKVASGDVEISCAEDYSHAMRLCYIGFLQIAMTYHGTLAVSESVWHSAVGSPISVGA